MSREGFIGKGLFEAAKEEHVLDQVYEEMKDLKDCFAENPAFSDTLCSPFLTVRDRITILDTVFGIFVHSFVLNAMKVLYEDKVRCSFDVFTENFIKEYEKETGILRVKAYSARPMSESEKDLLKQKLEQKTGKTVILQFFTDEKLVGGLKYEYNNMVFDGGVDGSLLYLKETIVAASVTKQDKGVN